MKKGIGTPGMLLTIALLTAGELLVLQVAGLGAPRSRDRGPKEMLSIDEVTLRPASEPGVILPVPGREGRKVAIGEGRIPFMAFIQFLSDFHGLPLLHDDAGRSFHRKEILIATHIPEADGDLVSAILEVNRWRVYRETLRGGREILKVEDIQRIGPIPEDPPEVRIYALSPMREVEP